MEGTARTQARRGPRIVPRAACANALSEHERCPAHISRDLTRLAQSRPHFHDVGNSCTPLSIRQVAGIQQRTKQDLAADEHEERHGLLDRVADLLGGDEDDFGIPRFDPADGQRGEVRADDFEHDTDGEDDHGGADEPHAEEREEAEARNEDGGGLHEVGRAEPKQQPGIREDNEQSGRTRLPSRAVIPSIVRDEDIHLLF